MHQHIHWAVKASRRVDTADLSKTLQLAERLVQQILGDDAVKQAMLSLIGLWGKPYSVQWHVERTWVKEDMDRVTMVGVDAEGVPPTHKAHTVILTNHSYMPVSLHVLYQEAVWWDKMCCVMLDRGIDFLGCIVDNFFLAYTPQLCEQCGVRQDPQIPYKKTKDEKPKYVDPKRCVSCILRAVLPEAVVKSRRRLTFPQALFKISEDVGEKVPRCTQRFEERDCTDYEPEDMQWNTVDEQDPELHRLLTEAGETPGDDPLDNVAALIAQNGGAFVDAGPGCGKTRALLPRIEKALLARNPETVIRKVAPTYVAAKQMNGGITCQAAVHRNVHNRFENQVMIVDEVSMIGKQLMERMARWHIMGLQFICMGDFSQLLAVGEDPEKRWRMETSRTLMGLRNNLRVLLTKNRRAAADPEHFSRIMMLRPWVDEDLTYWLHHFTTRYRWEGPDKQPISYYVCISHRNRMRINKWQNDLEKDRHERKLFIQSPGFLKGCSSQPQDMWVWPGLQLIGGGRRSQKILNGVLYIVHSFDETLRLTTHPDFGDETVEVSMEEAAENLRLCYAAVYHSCQGRTLNKEHVMLMDTQNPYFSGRHLYVGASRVTSGEYLHIASDEITSWINRQLRAVPNDDDHARVQEDWDARQDGEEEDFEV